LALSILHPCVECRYRVATVPRGMAFDGPQIEEGEGAGEIAKGHLGLCLAGLRVCAHHVYMRVRLCV
jgi:hypothetical protein